MDAAHTRRIHPEKTSLSPVLGRLFGQAINPMLVIGLAAASVALWLLAAKAIMTTIHSIHWQEKVKPPPGWREANLLGIGLVIGAGVLAILVGDWRKVSRKAILLYLILLGWMAGHLLLTYSKYPFSGAALVAHKGPLTWLTMALVFVGVDRSRWIHIDRVITILAFAGAASLFLTVPTLDGSRIGSLKNLGTFHQVLLWTSPWLLLTSGLHTGWKRVVRLLPFLALLMGTLLLVSRSWSLLSFLYFPAFIMINTQAGRAGLLKARFSTGKFLFIFGALTLIVVGIFIGHILTASEQLEDRLTEDTRSRQLVEFFSQVTAKDLLIGKGPEGRWLWRGEPYANLDLPYVLIMFNGGVPALFGYIALVIFPAYGVLLARRPRITDPGTLAAACLLGVWSLALTGLSTFAMPSSSINHFLLCLYAGRCYGALHERKLHIQARRADHQAHMRVLYQNRPDSASRGRVSMNSILTPKGSR
ncbi:hypothetical protein HQ520_11690 [bacterium]|nr:hypothetical protein [bacterium]